MECQVGRAQMWHKGSLGCLPLGLARSVQYLEGTQQIPYPWCCNIKSKRLGLNLRIWVFCHANVTELVLWALHCWKLKNQKQTSLKVPGLEDVMTFMAVDWEECYWNQRRALWTFERRSLAYNLPCCNLASTADCMHQIALFCALLLPIHWRRRNEVL